MLRDANVIATCLLADKRTVATGPWKRPGHARGPSCGGLRTQLLRGERAIPHATPIARAAATRPDPTSWREWRLEIDGGKLGDRPMSATVSGILVTGTGTKATPEAKFMRSYSYSRVTAVHGIWYIWKFWKRPSRVG